MGYLEETLETFGFTQDSAIIAIMCVVVLLGNFSGGLIANILLSFGGPIPERKLTQRTGFRLALVSELILIVYIVYYHTILVTDITMAQVIYWVFTLLAAPLLAAFGAQLGYVAMSKKIEQLKKEFREFESEKMDEAAGDDQEEVTDKA